MPKDVLALVLGGSKAWPAMKTLEKYGRAACGVRNPGHVIEDIITRVMEYQPLDSTSKIWKQVRGQVELGVMSIRAGAGARRSTH